jgi:ribosomal protein S1
MVEHAKDDERPIVEPEETAALSQEAAPDSKPAGPAADLIAARKADRAVTGKVIGWNKGGFHVVVDGFTAFCPQSEMEIGHSDDPKTYVDRELEFKVLDVRKKGRRVVLSRAAALKGERSETARKARGKLSVGATVSGRVASITDFGAFVELGGGIQGLVHVSELSRRHVGHPSEVVQEGEEIEVKVLKIGEGGKRISLSRKALEPDPWSEVAQQFEEGDEVTGTVEKTQPFGALIELAPGLTGLLPTSEMSLPRDTSPARAFPPGREVEVQIVSIDSRRHRISLAPKGAKLGGSRSDYEAYKKSADTGERAGFNALEAAFRKIQPRQ